MLKRKLAYRKHCAVFLGRTSKVHTKGFDVETISATTSLGNHGDYRRAFGFSHYAGGAETDMTWLGSLSVSGQELVRLVEARIVK